MEHVTTEVKVKADNEMAGDKVYELAGMHHDIMMAASRLSFLHEVGYNHLMDNIRLQIHEDDNNLLLSFFHDLEALKDEVVRIRDRHDVATNFLKLWWMENVEDKGKSGSQEN